MLFSKTNSSNSYIFTVSNAIVCVSTYHKTQVWVFNIAGNLLCLRKCKPWYMFSRFSWRTLEMRPILYRKWLISFSVCTTLRHSREAIRIYEVNDDYGRLIDQQDNFERYVKDERSELWVSRVIKCRITASSRGTPRGFNCEGGEGEEEVDPEGMCNLCWF